MTRSPVLVLGAGLAGVCTALELAQQGRRVVILDQDPDCLLRASFRAVDPGLAHEIAAEALRELGRIVPGLAAIAVHTVDAGVITAWGATDVDDPESALHDRYDVGPRACDGWISLDTGKLTTAPLFAERAAKLAAEASA